MTEPFKNTSAVEMLEWYSQFMGTLHESISRALLKAGVSQSELARRIGVTRAAVSNWVTGQTHISYGNLLKVARALNMSLEEIYGENAQLAETKSEHELLQLAKQLEPEQLEHFLYIMKLAVDRQDSGR